MRHRRIAILIDGSFFLKRLPKLVPQDASDTPEAILATIRRMCRNHISGLTGWIGPDDSDQWRHHLYRIFFYDARPYDGKKHHPLLNRTIDFAKSDVYRARTDLFQLLRKEPNVALRLGIVTKDGDWRLPDKQAKRLLATKAWMETLDFSSLVAGGSLTEEQLKEAKRLQELWTDVQHNHLLPGLRQKGVDMRIGLDIASITLKHQADTIVLVAGDSDFVPAAKLARREGIEFILDPMWQQINEDLFEHIDVLRSGLPRPEANQKSDEQAP